MSEILETKLETVIDGDTITVRDRGRLRPIRLQHIDAPEVGEPYFKESRYRLQTLLSGHNITIYGQTYDRYGRLIGRIVTEDLELPHLTLLAEGLAFHYTKYSRCELCRSAQIRARQKFYNLWSEEEYYERWEQKKTNNKRYVKKGDILVDIPDKILQVILVPNNEDFGTSKFYEDFERRIKLERIRTAGLNVKEIDNIILS